MAFGTHCQWKGKQGGSEKSTCSCLPRITLLNLLLPNRKTKMLELHRTSYNLMPQIMVTQQRIDLLMNIPALKKLHAMLIDCLDNFKDQNEFCYVSRDASDSEKGNAKRKVPERLCEPMLKAAMAINAQVLAEMEISENYIKSLPKRITVEFFDPDQFLSTRDLSVEHKTLDLKNRI
ncbi:hypothetical protein SLEP1_g26920 [Rubroshorea leprosula]|uniref:PRONE domain-containing protein n=1 Tax=Rubroshorea leprosula TaxID=152421 RepID=A0AAV5JXZ5_9ROSI|nr:hypothetical protein SLEP1_g26920 [Rubroshorea leprosula]